MLFHKATSFDTSDNDEKFPTGPTTFIPGPTLFKHVATAEKALLTLPMSKDRGFLLPANIVG